MQYFLVNALSNLHVARDYLCRPCFYTLRFVSRIFFRLFLSASFKDVKKECRIFTREQSALSSPGNDTVFNTVSFPYSGIISQIKRYNEESGGDFREIIVKFHFHDF